MTAFHQGLALVIEQLTAQKRLLRHTPTASPTQLRALLNANPTPPPKTLEPSNPQTLKPVTPNPQTPNSPLSALQTLALSCTKCPQLVASRTQVVFGSGNIAARLLFVGEAPGEDEDLQGEPFVGAAGQLLNKMIVAMGLQREDVYISNVVKCRPDMPPGKSGNRKPTTGEMATCLPYLLEQIDLIRPEVIVALGATAVEGLLGAEVKGRPMGELRGQWLEVRGTPLMATYHPAYLLRNQATSEKRKVWEDLLLVMEKLSLPISEKQRNFFTK